MLLFADTAVGRAWRSAALLVTFNATLGQDATPEQVQAAMADVTAASRLLRHAFPAPHSGAPWAVSDYWDVDWAQSYWDTATYAQLQVVKAR